MRILVTTDNHVGYNETDPLRGPDSARTFDEIMEIAETHAVDLVLQGGDLFHINKPSKQSLYDVIRTLRRRCLGDKPIEFETLHHGQLSLDAPLDHANYEDSNLNVGIPLFAISGNHDDRGGAVLLSPLDLLAATGLINYFGRVLDNDDIQVTPLLFRKNGVKVAVYGLSNVRDERLHRAFRNGNVKFLTTPDQDSYFNVLMVHQNRSAHTDTNYLPEHFIPSFFQLVVWGHEHECRIDPEISPVGFEVIQPGSSVATSLCEGETVPKSVAILEITSNKRYSLTKVPLRTVRPFKMATLSVQRDSNIKPNKNSEKEISAWLKSHVMALVQQASQEYTQGNPGGTPPLPLIRLRVDYSGGYQVENPTRFSNKFIDLVANPHDVLQYTRAKDPAAAAPPANPHLEFDELAEGMDKVQLSELVHQFLEKQTLQVIPEKGMTSAISQFVDQDDKAALREFVDLTLRTNVQSLIGEEQNSAAPDPLQDPELPRAPQPDSDSPVEEEMRHPPKRVAKPRAPRQATARSPRQATARSPRQTTARSPRQATARAPIQATARPPIQATALRDEMDSDDGFD